MSCKMGKKRERLELIYDILCTIRDNNNSIKPTRLLQLSNLSSQMFKDYISELQGKSFIRDVEDKKGKKFFSLTDKGFRFLEKYKVIQNLITDFGL